METAKGYGLQTTDYSRWLKPQGIGSELYEADAEANSTAATHDRVAG
jgi:hypothetical protein